MIKNVYTNKNQMEIKQPLEFPFYSGHDSILNYENSRFNWHWHKEIEFILVYEGEMVCKVNEKEYLLTNGSCLFINSNVLHMGTAVSGKSCLYNWCILMPSVILQSIGKLGAQYIDSILDCSCLSSFLLQTNTDWQNKLISYLKEADLMFQKKNDCYELELISLLIKLWSLFYQNVKDYINVKMIPEKNIIKLKQILSFIHNNYNKKISLNDIAKSANISKSDCGHFFKLYMHESPFEYLLRYRIEKSLIILTNEDKNITETALSVGFSGASYYTEIFKRYMGITPKEYKKEHYRL